MSVTSVGSKRSAEEAGGSLTDGAGQLTDSAWPRVVASVRIIDANDPGSVLADVEAGMTVIGASCAKLGTVTHVYTSAGGEPVALSVAYGLLARKHKYVLGEFVDLVDGDRVVLSIDHTQFRALRDTDE
jgi:hypothetical protein